MTYDAGGPAGTGYAPRPVRPRPGGRPPPARRHPPQLAVVALAAALVLVGLVVAWLGQRTAAAVSARPAVAWALSPASNTVTIRLTPGGGPAARRILAHSHLAVSGDGNGQEGRRSADGRTARVPVPPGGRPALWSR